MEIVLAVLWLLNGGMILADAKRCECEVMQLLSDSGAILEVETVERTVVTVGQVSCIRHATLVSR
jgi:hypothetical protein